MTIRELAPQIQAGKLSPVELAAETFRRIRQLNPALNAYITVLEEPALEQARQAEREIRTGHYRGPLHGIPYAAKDLFYTRGVATTAGSKLFRDFVPDYDAAVIERLRDAGAVLVGKAGLHELAYGVTNNNPHFGAVHNPWGLDRIPGGSSGGSTTALAAGLCTFALGSDTGGSVRIPASFCGVTGLKPTFGRISRYGVFPLGHTLDHVGHFGQTVADVATILEALAGPDPRDDSSANEPPPRLELPADPKLKGVRIGVPRSYYFERLQPEVDSAVKAALKTLQGLGAELQEIEIPEIEDFTVMSRLILMPEATALHRRHLKTRRADIGPDVLALLDQGQFVLATDYLDAQRRRRQLVQNLAKLFDQVRVIVTPTTPSTAPKIGQTTMELGGRQEDVRLGSTRLVRALNVAGVPALSAPCGFDGQGLPIGLQIFGRAFDEAGVLLVGHAYEQATEWHKRRPKVNAV
ncbi:MAG: Asp-tRNA(Asn)/Glu-tRNA(Gln) amidotransferase subunit GatA [Acidobacteria bacterium]|nr:Asp-tRNA(Asn)/Glu-tRNA(Gln) amidotransferase subunit GatA [Acidobacteriota bacterium]